MQVIQIIEVGLKAQGLGGLVVPGTCGCVIGDLSPGNCLSDDCEAGYKHQHSSRFGDWVVSKNPEQMTDEEIERVIAVCG